MQGGIFQARTWARQLEWWFPSHVEVPLSVSTEQDSWRSCWLRISINFIYLSPRCLWEARQFFHLVFGHLGRILLQCLNLTDLPAVPAHCAASEWYGFGWGSLDLKWKPVLCLGWSCVIETMCANMQLPYESIVNLSRRIIDIMAKPVWNLKWGNEHKITQHLLFLLPLPNPIYFFFSLSLPTM